VHVVCFELEGPWALFRKPYSPLSPVSYPFPPPPAVLGLIGAVLGLGKTEYAEALGWADARVGARLLRPVRTFQAGINLLNTKEGVDSLWRPWSPKKDAHRMQVPHEFLVDPAWRIWLAGIPHELAADLQHRLREGRAAYTPTLGLANCLAEVRFVDAGEATELGPCDTLEDLSCVVPVIDSLEVDYDALRPYERFRVPAEMDAARVVHRYPEVLIATDAGPVTVRGVPRWQLGRDRFCLL